MDVSNAEHHGAYRDLRTRLIAALRDGDDGPVRAFYDDHLKWVYRYVLARMDGRHEVTEEIVADVFFQAFRDIRNYDARHEPQAWLQGIARHRVLDAFRRNGRKPAAELGLSAGHEEGEGLLDLEAVELSQEALERAEVAEAVEEALARLPAGHERVLRLFYLDDRSVKDLAADLGVTAKAAEARLFRARNAFREVFRVPSGECRSAGGSPFTSARESSTPRKETR